MLAALAQKHIELGLHTGCKAFQPRDVGQRTAFECGQRCSQDAGSTGVGVLHHTGSVEHDDTGRQVVEDGLQVGAGFVHLLHAVLHGAAGVGQLLRHLGERAGQPAQFVFALQHGFGRQVTRRHLAHTFGQQQQRTRQLVAQQHGKNHCTKNGQKQAQGQCADVHPAQPATGQCTLLVFAVGLGHGNGIGQQRGGQRLGHLQKACFGQQAHAGAGHGRQGLDAGVFDIGGTACVVQPFDLRDEALAAHVAQLLRAGTLGVELEAGLPGAGNHVPGTVPQHHVIGGQLVADALQRQTRCGVGSAGQLAARHTGAVGQVTGQGVEGGAAQAQPGVERGFHLDVKPALDGARHELVGHDINQHTRQKPHQRKNGRQFDQQTAAKPPAPHTRQQTPRDPHNDGKQQHSHHHVDGEQAGVIAFVQQPVVGGLCQHEHQHQANRQHGGHPHPHGPAHGARMQPARGRSSGCGACTHGAPLAAGKGRL